MIFDDEPTSCWKFLPVLTDFLSVVHASNDKVKLFSKASKKYFVFQGLEFYSVYLDTNY